MNLLKNQSGVSGKVKILFLMISMITGSSTYALQQIPSKNIDAEKQCSFLKEKSANAYCMKEQQDEVIIFDATKKGIDYTIKNIDEITNKVKTVVGMMFFVDKLEEKMLSPIDKNIAKEQYKKELNEMKRVHSILAKKLKGMYPEYEKNLLIWQSYDNMKNEDKLAVNDFAKNRYELLNVLKRKMERMSYWTKDLNYYLKNKEVNEKLVLPLYLGQSIDAKREECSMIKLNVPGLYETKIKLIKGCNL